MTFFQHFRLTVSTEAGMMSRDTIMLIDLNGEEQFLTKLQVNSIEHWLFYNLTIFTRWGWSFWPAGWRSCWPGCPQSCFTRLTLQAWRAAPVRSSSSTCLERRNIFTDTKVSLIGNYMKSYVWTFISELSNTTKAVKVQETSMLKRLLCCCRGIIFLCKLSECTLSMNSRVEGVHTDSCWNVRNKCLVV